MADLGFGLGVLLAIAGPLLLLPAAWLLQRCVLHPSLRRLAGGRLRPLPLRLAAWGAAALLLAGALAGTYFPGRAEFRALCAAYATPRIDARAAVDGYYRERLFPYQARQVLAAGFAFVEAPDPYRDGRTLRYTLAPDGMLRQAEVEALRSRHGAAVTLVEHAYGILRTEKRVYALADRRLLARAGSVVFEGGPLARVLGVYAVASCPDPRTPGGRAAFTTFHDLETIVLRGAAGPG